MKETMMRVVGRAALAFALCGALAVTLHAAWTYEEDFNALTNGDLHGQAGCLGSTDYDVQTGTAYEGAKAVAVTIVTPRTGTGPRSATSTRLPRRISAGSGPPRRRVAAAVSG
jgi:hypothetical protein